MPLSGFIKGFPQNFCIVPILLIFLIEAAFSQEHLERGLHQYSAENYEEALEIFQELYKKSPSTYLSYYLGLTYKQIGEPFKAREFFREALKGEPKIYDSLVELALISYQLDDLKEAKEYLKEAELLKIKPGTVSYIKGLILLKEGHYREAREAFLSAKNLDKSLEQLADFQISIAYLSESKFGEAKKSLEALIETFPKTEIADFAKDYLSALNRILKAHKDWTIIYNMGYLYDDNVVSKPSGMIGIEAVDKISGKRDSAVITNLKIIYKPLTLNKFYFYGSYELYYRNYFRTYEYDLLVSSVELTPGLTFRDGIIIFPLTYHHLWLNEREYMSLFYFRPTVNLQTFRDQIFQFSIGYGKREILKYIVNFDPNEDRDSDQYLISLGYFYSFKNNKALLYSKYEYLYDNTEGRNWKSNSHRVSVGILYPLVDKLISSLSGEYTWQYYKNIHTLSGIGINGFPDNEMKRRDKIFGFSAGVNYELSKSLSFNLRYSYTMNDSNFPIYDYRRNLYSIEVSLSF